jgi:pimeloyl-ACP methyl ester carboxylesterase
VPSIALHGADDGVQPPEPADPHARHFTGPYRREIIPGVGHNLPQEAPGAFADAILDLLARPEP